MERIDKYLWCVRLFKTRSLATSACKEGKVKLNNVSAKSSKMVHVGDVVSIKNHGVFFLYKIKDTLSKRVGAKLVDNYIINVTPPEDLERFKVHQMAQEVYREKGQGRPTKKDRRDIDDLLS